MADPIVLTLESNPFSSNEPSSILFDREANREESEASLVCAYSKLEGKMAEDDVDRTGKKDEKDEARIFFEKEEETEGKEEDDEDELEEDEEEEEIKEMDDIKPKTCEACQKQRVHFEPPADSKLGKPSSLEDFIQQLGTQRTNGLNGPFSLYGPHIPLNGIGPYGFGFGCCCPGGTPSLTSLGLGNGFPEAYPYIGPFEKPAPNTGEEEAPGGGFIPNGTFRPPGGPEPCGPGIPVFPPPAFMNCSMPPATMPGYPMGFAASPFNLLGWLASPWIPNPFSSLFNFGMPCSMPYGPCGIPAATPVPPGPFVSTVSSQSPVVAPCKMCGQCFPSETTDFGKLRRADGALPVSVQEEEIKTKRKNYREKHIPSPDGRTISSRELVNEEEVLTNRRDIFYETERMPDLGERTGKFSPAGDCPPTTDSKSNYPSTRTSPTESANPDHETEDDTSEEAVEKDDVQDSTTQNESKTKQYSNSVASEDDRDYSDALDVPTTEDNGTDLPALQDPTPVISLPASTQTTTPLVMTSQVTTETTTTRTVRNPSYMRPQMSSCPLSNLQMYGYAQPPTQLQVCTSDPMVFQPVDPQRLTATHTEVTTTTTTTSTQAPRTCASVIPPSPESVISCDSLVEGTGPWQSDSQTPPYLPASGPPSDIVAPDGDVAPDTDFFMMQAELEADMPATTLSDTQAGTREEVEEVLEQPKAQPPLFGPFQMPLLDDASDALMVRNTDKDLFMSELRSTLPLESGDAVAGDCLEEVADRLGAAGEPKQKNYSIPGSITASVSAIPVSELWTPTTHPCSKIHLLEVVSDPCDDIKRNEYCSTS